MTRHRVPPTPEEWRPVCGYEGVYEVSSRGRVKRIGEINPATWAGRILAIARDKSGYLSVCLCRRGQRNKLVHRLVLEAFANGPHPESQANHIDGIKANNHIDNLEWCSAAENGAHAARLGLKAKGDRNGTHTHPESVRRGEQNGRAKLTESEVHEIKSLITSDIAAKVIATRFGVSAAAVNLIARGRNWKHLVDQEVVINLEAL